MELEGIPGPKSNTVSKLGGEKPQVERKAPGLEIALNKSDSMSQSYHEEVRDGH